MRCAIFALAAFVGLTVAAPVSDLEVRANICRSQSYHDYGSYTKPCSTYTAALTCPNGIQKKSNGIVLLVHGTGSTGAETWANGPYVSLLPDEGFDVCYVDLPSRALVDIQLSAEYVAYLIHNLAPQSATKKVGVVTHSQGGPLAQWVFDFWPATRDLTSTFVAIAPDFRGTIEGVAVCTVLQLALGGCNPSVFQQSSGSLWLDALNAKGNVALVPTTSIYTAYDDVIQPELITPTSRLSGATVVRVQDKCSSAYLMEHFGIPFASYPYYLALNALKNQAAADVQSVETTACGWILDDYLLERFDRGPTILKEVVSDALAVILGPKVKKEPALKSYVCKRGDMASGCA
ncbi:hypothetical protein JCM8547_000193 [Rhodosporidiobolus lusitaniae]